MENKDLNISILNYTLIKESLESTFSILVNSKKNKFIYELKYPSNPIIDCYFVNLNNKSLNSIIKFIDKEALLPLDKSVNYSQILEKLKDFKNWLLEIISDKKTNETNKLTKSIRI